MHGLVLVCSTPATDNKKGTSLTPLLEKTQWLEHFKPFEKIEDTFPPPKNEPPQDIILLYPCSKILENQLKTLGETRDGLFGSLHLKLGI